MTPTIIQSDRDAAAKVNPHTVGFGGATGWNHLLLAFATYRQEIEREVRERCAAYLEAQAKQARDIIEVGNVQSALPIKEPMFSYDALVALAAAIRADGEKSDG